MSSINRLSRFLKLKDERKSVQMYEMELDSSIDDEYDIEFECSKIQWNKDTLDVKKGQITDVS